MEMVEVNNMIWILYKKYLGMYTSISDISNTKIKLKNSLSATL